MSMYGLSRMASGAGYGYGLDWTYILVIIGAMLSLWASSKVKTTFNKYAKVAASCGITGAEVARAILRKEGLYDVEVGHIAGDLTDHYNPATKKLNLSDPVYNSPSLAAIGVAAHECGHAIQHGEGYFPLKFRSAFVPVANIGSKVGIPCIIVGVIFSFLQPLIVLGVVLFSFGVIFQLITLPVEFDASRRALAVIEEMGLVSHDELQGSRKVLSAAAMTYVASAASAILSLLRLIILFGGGRRRD